MKKSYNIKKLKCLSPDGREDCPQGVYLAKGGWHKNVRINENSFITDVKSDPFGNMPTIREQKTDYKGGIIIFPVSSESNANDDVTAAVTDFFRDINKLSEELSRHDASGTFAVGKFFYGNYTYKNEDVFNNESLCVKVGQVSGKVLLLLAGELAAYLEISSFIIKDLNKEKFYIGEKA